MPDGANLWWINGVWEKKLEHKSEDVAMEGGGEGGEGCFGGHALQGV